MPAEFDAKPNGRFIEMKCNIRRQNQDSIFSARDNLTTSIQLGEVAAFKRTFFFSSTKTFIFISTVLDLLNN